MVFKLKCHCFDEKTFSIGNFDAYIKLSLTVPILLITDVHPFEPYVYFKVIILMEIGDIKWCTVLFDRWCFGSQSMMTFLNIFLCHSQNRLSRLIWLKTNGVPSFHLESIRPFWFTRSCRFDSFIRSPFENVVPFSFKWAPAELL